MDNNKRQRQVYNTITETFEYTGSYEECQEYFNKHDNGHLEITC